MPRKPPKPLRHRAEPRARKVAPGARGRSASILETAQLAVGNFLRATREAAGLTQAEIAERTLGSPWQLSRAAVSAIERGQNFPGLEAMLALSNVLHIDPKELIERARLSAVVQDVSGASREELEKRAAQYFWAGDFKNALAIYDALHDRLVHEEGDEGHRLLTDTAEVEIKRATALKRAGALVSAIASAERALILARNRPALSAQAYVVLADLQVQRGHLPLARDCARRAIELAEASGELPLQAWALMVSAGSHYIAGEFEMARTLFEKARARATAGGDTAHLTHIEGNIGQCWVAQGRLEDGRAALERAIAMARKGRQSHLEASFTVELGKIALTEGRLADARHAAQMALKIAVQLEHPLTVFRAEWLLHKLTRRITPDAGEGERLARLHQLFLGLDQHEGVDEVREFREELRQGVETEEPGQL